MLKLISWNSQCARTASGGADLKQIAERLHAAADPGGADIVLLQEVACRMRGRDGSLLGDQFAGLAARLPGYHAVSTLALETPDAGMQPRGLGCMTLSRYPILQVRRHALPWPPDPDPHAQRRSMPRAVLDTVIATPAGPLRVLSVHLDYFSLRQRLAQVGYLRRLGAEALERVAAMADRGHGSGADIAPDSGHERNNDSAHDTAHAILAGDFNFLPGSECHQHLFGRGDSGDSGEPAWRDAWPLVHPDAVHAPTVGLHDPARDAQAFTFDYACVSPALAPRVRAVRVDTAIGASDHQPLVLEWA